jgi:signal transduction histidine kinase
MSKFKDAFWKRLRALIDVPILDAEERQRSRLLNVLLISFGFIAVLSIFISIAVSLIAFDVSPYLFFSVQFAVLIIIGIIYGINRYSPGKLARVLFLGFLLFLFLFVDDPDQVANGRSTLTFAIPIIMASLLFPAYASFIVAGIVSLETALLSIGLGLTPDPFTILVFFTIALFTWLIAYTMGRAVNGFRLLNEQLEQRVKDRTQELAAALTRERELSERERTLAVRNETILKSIADGVLVFDANEDVIMANPAANHLAQRNLKDTSLNDFLAAIDNPTGELIKSWILGERPIGVNNVRFEWNGSIISANITSVMLSNLHERQIGIGNVMVLRDITKEAELEKAKDMFLGMVSHELRTPLTAIQGFAEILKETAKDRLPIADYEFVGIIYNNARQMHSLVEELLDISRLETGRLDLYCQWVELPALIDNAAKTVGAEFSKRDLNLEVIYQDDLPNLHVDPTRITQVLLNLLSNAYKYTDKGGATVDVSQSGQWISIAVSDTGVGIKESEQENVFSRFFRSQDPSVQKAGGTGLGLNISKGLIELHGGTLVFESTYGKGTTFTANLPLHAPKVTGAGKNINQEMK